MDFISCNVTVSVKIRNMKNNGKNIKFQSEDEVIGYGHLLGCSKYLSYAFVTTDVESGQMLSVSSSRTQFDT
jgi:hypothetical protein